jgi:hypothetical protein
MSETKYMRVGVVENAEETFFIPVFEQVFIYFSGTAMHEKQSCRFFVYFIFHTYMFRKVTKIGTAVV